MSINFELDEDFSYDVESALFGVDFFGEKENRVLVDEIWKRHKVDLMIAYEEFFQAKYPYPNIPSPSQIGVKLAENVADVSLDDPCDEEQFEQPLCLSEVEDQRYEEYFIFDGSDPFLLPDVPVYSSDKVKVIPIIYDSFHRIIGDEFMEPDEAMDEDDELQGAAKASEEDNTQDAVKAMQQVKPDGREFDAKMLSMLKITPFDVLPAYQYSSRLIPFIRLATQNKRSRLTGCKTSLGYVQSGDVQIDYFDIIIDDENFLVCRIPFSCTGVGTWKKFKNNYVWTSEPIDKVAKKFGQAIMMKAFYDKGVSSDECPPRKINTSGPVTRKVTKDRKEKLVRNTGDVRFRPPSPQADSKELLALKYFEAMDKRMPAPNSALQQD